MKAANRGGEGDGRARSRTLEIIGLEAEILRDSRFQSLRAKLQAMDAEARQSQTRLLTASPDVLVGSVQAVTEQGQVLIASATGTQLSPAASGAGRIIWVVGTHSWYAPWRRGCVASRNTAFRRKIYARARCMAAPVPSTSS